MVARPLDALSLASWIKYLVTLIFFATINSLLVLFYQLRITGCSGYGYEPEAYLAQCASKTYGDYEHGALALKIENRAIDYLERAQVVVLGDSHAMVAFSGTPTREYFSSRGMRFYNAALSGEISGFFEFFLSTVRLRAKVIVIDVDPFFLAGMSQAGRFIVEQPTRALLEYWIKQKWQVAHRYSCSSAAPIVRWFCGNAFSVFRSVTDGRLIVDWTRVYGSPLPRLPATRGVHTPAENELRINVAKEFLSRLHLDASCVILTAIPMGWVGDFSDSAQAIALALGASYINPSIEGLTVMDGVHLDESSAAAWSEQFWREATPIIEHCLGMK